MSFSKNTQPLNVLVIEDNQQVAANIGDYLGQKGHIVDFAMDGLTGLHLAATLSFDVIVLDLMLPGIDGISLCRRLREDGKISIPILMLTAKDTLEDKLEGFEAGADDYLLKPFELKELEVRLKALARRSQKVEDQVLIKGGVRVDKKERSVTINGSPIELNRTCFNLLVELLEEAPNLVSREELEKRLWGDYKPSSDALRSHVYTLRKKMKSTGKDSLIETVLGVGFRMNIES